MRTTPRTRLALTLALALALASTVTHAQSDASLPLWSGPERPGDSSSAGVRVTLRFAAGAVTFESDAGRTTRVSGATALDALTDGALRGYRRRYGMRSRPDGSVVRGGHGPLETRVVAPATLPLARLAALVTPNSYASWERHIALSVRRPDGTQTTLPMELVSSRSEAALALPGSTTLDAALRAASGAPRGARLRIFVTR